MLARRLLTTVCATVLLAAASAAGASAHSGHSDHDRAHGIIVWTHRAAPGSEHLMVARADGSNARPLTQPARATVDIDAQVSPDGRWVAYQKELPETASIHLVRTNGRDDHLLEVGCADPCVVAGSPTWLSNRRLGFTLVKGPMDDVTGPASAALWTARIDGSGVRRFSEPGTDGRFEDSYLRLSRDGSYYLFQRLESSTGKAALFRRQARGGHLTQLTPWNIKAEVNDLSTARHGPTKDLVVFESYGRGDPDATFADIATVPATCRSLAACTARIHWLTDNAASGRRNANPQWSPSGKSMVFTDRASVDIENADIWTMRFGSTHRHRISTSQQFDFRPTWGVRP